jgi:hypothetical protein
LLKPAKCVEELPEPRVLGLADQPVPSAGLDSVDRTHGDPEENVHGPSRLNEVQSSDRSCEATYRVSISRISAWINYRQEARTCAVMEGFSNSGSETGHFGLPAGG